MFSGRRAEWNGGWDLLDPFPYTVLSEVDFFNHFIRLCNNSRVCGADCATFQPFPAPNVNQDRYVVHEWNIPGSGAWKLWGVFDGAPPLSHFTVLPTLTSIFANDLRTYALQDTQGTRRSTTPRVRCPR